LFLIEVLSSLGRDFFVACLSQTKKKQYWRSVVFKDCVQD
jgi:hypothetical protein